MIRRELIHEGNLFPMKLDEKVFKVTTEDFSGVHGRIFSTKTLVVETYIKCLFGGFFYRLKKFMNYTVPLAPRRQTTSIIYDSGLHNLLTKEKMINMKEETILSWEKEREKEYERQKLDGNTGNCIICKQPQNHVTMSRDYHICIGCRPYVKWVTQQIDMGFMKTHKLIKEERLAKEKGKWFLIIKDDEIKGEIN